MDRITILLIDGSADFAKLVQSWIATGSSETSMILKRAETLESGLRQLAFGGVDLILLDLNLPDSSGFNTFEATRANAPGIPVIVLSTGDAEAITLQTIHKGAEDYLVKSKCGPELFTRVVESAFVRHKARETSKATKVIGVLGAGGGTGVTTVACNFAAELRRQSNEKVLLADLNLHTGLVPFIIGITETTTFSMRDAVENLHRLDQSCWESMVLHGPDDLHIVASPDLLGTDDLPVAAIARVLNLIKPFYQWLVLDLGRLNSFSMGLLGIVDDVFVITSTAVSSIYGAILAVNSLKGAGFEGARLSLIVNQVGKAQPLSEKEIEKLFGIEIAARLSSVPQEMEEAYQQKRLPGEDSVFGRQIAVLVQKVAGLPEQASKRNSWAVQSLLQGFRRPRVAPRDESKAERKTGAVLKLDI